MGSEERGYLRHMLLDIKCCRSCHPFVEMGDHILRFQMMESVKTLDDDTCSICEQGCFMIITIGGNRIYTIIHPHFSVDIVLFLEKCIELHQKDNRISGYFPPSNTNRKVLIA
ncbi:hypothetical protein SDC9_202276 [bioreactor metagenome]|uniref:Uncharacterized protein n=1 Tax=bioreactor metagenome TaxID=1076179 RepID=A0A645IT61_9ZZZZ